MRKEQKEQKPISRIKPRLLTAPRSKRGLLGVLRPVLREKEEQHRPVLTVFLEKRAEMTVLTVLRPRPRAA